MAEPLERRAIGRYSLVRRLGRGAMGTVYLAYDPQISRPVAIKVLNTHDELFLPEVRAAGNLKHPNIVTVYDCSQQDGESIIVMESVLGRTLEHFIRWREIHELSIKLHLIRQLCSALACAHDHGIIHRDIKPANLIVDHEFRLKVLDFGLARIGEPSARETGIVMGTLKYMSPEQMVAGAVDRRTDIYAVGVVVYELLASQHPFPTNSPLELRDAVLNQHPRPLNDVRPELPLELWRIASTALQKDSARRYA